MKGILDGSETPPAGSSVLRAQRRLAEATQQALDAIRIDVREGLRQTVGIEVRSIESQDERCAVALVLPPDTNGISHERIAQAIDAENVEAWCDAQGGVCVGIAPWFNTKDVDQVVLSVTKIVHVMLGLHASDNAPQEAKSFSQRLLSSVREILVLQSRRAQK